MNLQDKVIIVTGAGSGIGAAVAIGLAKEGANVAIVGRREEKLMTTAEKCAVIGKEVLIIKADVTIEEDAKRIIQTTIDKYGELDVLVNNAGICKPGSICQGDILKGFDIAISTNVRSVLHLTTLATPYLIKTKGNIINISSATTTCIVGPELFTYAISKAALNYFTKVAAAELAPHGIRVNSVSPGPVETDILINCDIPWKWDDVKASTALNKVSQPDEIADVVIFLASEKARSVTGSNYFCDNGFCLK